MSRKLSGLKIEEFRVSGSEFRVLSFGFRVSGSELVNASAIIQLFNSSTIIQLLNYSVIQRNDLMIDRRLETGDRRLETVDWRHFNASTFQQKNERSEIYTTQKE